jgi:Protein of unknown function (DUF1116)
MSPPHFDETVSVVNVGLSMFADIAESAPTASVYRVAWEPPPDADPATASSAARLFGESSIDEANALTIDALLAADPVVVDVQPAQHVIALLNEGRQLLHAGPPIAWEEMCGPMRGALIGAALFEGWATSPDDAEMLLGGGGIGLSPCHDASAVGPMAGVISPSMPVWVVEDASSGRRSFSNLNEGLGKVLRFGANNASVITRLEWMREELGPLLGEVMRAMDGVPLRSIMAQALHMGDEVHNRNAAATGQFLKRVAPVIAATAHTSSVHVRSLEFIGSNDHFFLNLSMAACKLMTDAASGVPHSSIVTAMARNGVNFGIRVSGLGQQWFEAPASVINGLYFPGYGPTDATPDLGDSAITETAGFGGFAMAAPAIVGFVGGTPNDAVGHTKRMRNITLAENPMFTIPTLGFEPIGCGIDIRAVIDTGILPIINTGIAHRDAGVGQIGAGITTAPFACFAQAARSLERSVALR